MWQIEMLCDEYSVICRAYFHDEFLPTREEHIAIDDEEEGGGKYENR